MAHWGNRGKVKEHMWSLGKGQEILVLLMKAVRIVTSANPLDHCKTLIIQSKIQTVVNLYLFNLIIHILNNPRFVKNFRA